MAKVKAMKKIKEEYVDINNCPNSNNCATVCLVDEENIFQWRVTLIGPKDISYNGGIFILRINFPENYPEKGPEVFFITPIYHVNTNPTKSYDANAEPFSHVCISALNWWKPEYSMMEVLTNIFGLFYMTN